MFAQRQQLKRKATLANRARSMRHQPTPSEAKLWGAIAAGQLGVSFKRQVPIGGNFIVDFLAPAARLVIEVDGSAHTSRGAADSRKDRQLARLGYRVLRLPAELVLLQLPAAVERVRRALAEP